MHALFSLVGGGELPADLHRRLLVHDDADVRAWAVRAAGEMSPLDDDVRRQVARLRGDPAPVVRLQVAIAAGKIADLDPLPLLVDVVVHSPSDTLIPRVAWQNLLPLLDERYSEVVANLRQRHLRESPGLARLVRRLSEWMVSSSAADAETVAQLLEWLLEDEQRGLGVVHHFLGELADRLHANEISEERRAAIAARLTGLLTTIMGETSTSAALGAAQVMGSWQDEDGLRVVRARLTDYDPPADWLRSLRTLILNRDPQALAAAMNVLDSGTALTEDLRPAVLAELARSDSAEVATEVLARYASMSPPLQTRAVDLLASRAMWAQPLLERSVGGEINAMALNANQARKMVNLRDDGLRDTIEQYWGTVRAERDPTREALVWKMENFVWRTPGDPHRGVHVFENACAKCHKIYGRGEEVGPDITHNGRSNFEQLLDNVFDPSRVIGAPYRAHIVVTSDGRTLTGVLVENSAQRVLLKTEGGKQVAIAKTDIDLLEESPISLMPEGLEKQLEKQELADLIAFLALDRPPSDPAARLIDGAPPEITW